jgi:hypothetical protein
LRNLGVLSCNISWGGSSNEVEVQDTPDDVVLEVLATSVVNVDVHSVGVQQEDTMGSVASVVIVDGVSSVEILALWSPVRISGVDRPCIVGAIEHEFVGVFTETIQVRLLRKMSLEVHVLALEDQLLTSGVEKNFSGGRTRDGERKRVRLEIEFKLGVLG